MSRHCCRRGRRCCCCCCCCCGPFVRFAHWNCHQTRNQLSYYCCSMLSYSRHSTTAVLRGSKVIRTRDQHKNLDITMATIGSHFSGLFFSAAQSHLLEWLPFLQSLSKFLCFSVIARNQHGGDLSRRANRVFLYKAVFERGPEPLARVAGSG